MDPASRVVWMPGGVRTELHLVSQDTSGAFCLLIDHPPSGWSLPAHLHEGVAETIHIIDGEFDMTIGGQHELLRPGETAHVPPDVVHSGANVGAAIGRRLVIFSPAGMENFFLEAGARSADIEVDRRAALASATRHGWQFVT
jgi:mannose-6-phosphate isomerase-like protein (cupin superfamily)